MDLFTYYDLKDWSTGCFSSGEGNAKPRGEEDLVVYEVQGRNIRQCQEVQNPGKKPASQLPGGKRVPFGTSSFYPCLRLHPSAACWRLPGATGQRKHQPLTAVIPDSHGKLPSDYRKKWRHLHPWL
jgi:hypothetical protein